MRNGKCLYCDQKLDEHDPEICQKISDGTREMNQVLQVLHGIYPNGDPDSLKIHSKILEEILFTRLDFDVRFDQWAKDTFFAGHAYGSAEVAEQDYLHYMKRSKSGEFK